MVPGVSTVESRGRRRTSDELCDGRLWERDVVVTASGTRSLVVTHGLAKLELLGEERES